MKDNRPKGLWHLYKMGGFTPAITSMFDTRNAQQMAFIRSVMKEQRKNELYSVALQELDVVVFDLETTGFSPYNGDEIISIGAIAMTGQLINKEESFHSLVNPQRIVPREIELLTGITNEMAQNAPELIQVLRDFLEFVHKRILVAHGSAHDKHFLNSALWKTSKVNLSHRIIDCMMIAKWLDPKSKRYDLDYLLDRYQIQVTERHNALEDSRMTAQLWARQLEEVLAKDVHTLGDLYNHLSYL